MKFPELEALYIPFAINRRLDPNEVPEAKAFLYNHSNTLKFVQLADPPTLNSDGLGCFKDCRLKFIPKPEDLHLGDQNTAVPPTLLVQKLSARLEVVNAILFSERDFVSEGLERLTLYYSNGQRFSDGLLEKLESMFQMIHWMEFPMLSSLVCRFDHPDERFREEKLGKHAKGVLVIMDAVADLFGAKLEHLSGLLPKTQLPAKVVGKKLSKLSKLRRLGVYDGMIGSSTRPGLQQYVWQLKNSCPTLETVEVFESAQPGDWKPDARPILVMNTAEITPCIGL